MIMLISNEHLILFIVVVVVSFDISRKGVKDC